MGKISVKNVESDAVEAEQAVLGSILIDCLENGTKGIIRDVLSFVQESDFLRRENRITFRAIRYLFSEGEAVDLFTVKDLLRSYKDIPYDNYLAQLCEITPTAANWKAYAERMRKFARDRRIQKKCAELQNADTEEAQRSLIASLVEIIGTGHDVEAWTSKQLFADFCARQEKEVEGFRFGFEILDRVVLPEKGDYVIIAAEPDGGKTAFSIQCMYQMSSRYKVGYFTLETVPQDIADRAISSAAGVSYTEVKRHKLESDSWTRIASLTSDYDKRHFTVIKADGYDVTKIRAVSQSYGFDVVFVDYAQLVEPSDVSSNDRRQLQVAKISRDLKSFGRNTGILVIATAQLTRPKNEWREPNMHDIADSSQFEKDADLMMFLYKPNPDEESANSDDDTVTSSGNRRILKIAKNKKGNYGKYELFFDGDHQKFSFIAPI